MNDTYRALAKVPGAKGFSAAGALGRLEISMVGLGVVLLVTLTGGSYAMAGALSATAAIACAIGSPVLSRRVDRMGQAQVVPVLLVLHGVGIGLFIWAVLVDAPIWTQFLFAAVLGAFEQSVGSLVRARWTYALTEDRPRLLAAYAWESIVDEFVFVIGPPLATILSVEVAPWAGLGACAVLTLVGGLWLVAQRSTQPPPTPAHESSGPAVLRLRGLVPLLLIMVLAGGVFGSFELATVAYAAEQDARSLTGVLLAVFALGSLSSGLLYGATTFAMGLPARMVAGTAVLAATMVPFVVPGNLWVRAVAIFVAGLSVSPVLITASGLIERLVPDAQLTEGFALQFAGLSVGIALAAPLAGYLIDTRQSIAGYAVALACAAGAAGCAITARSTLAGAQADNHWDEPAT